MIGKILYLLVYWNKKITSCILFLLNRFSEHSSVASCQSPPPSRSTSPSPSPSPAPYLHPALTRAPPRTSPLLNFKAIRNFGHTLSRLQVLNSSFWSNKVESYVNQYCYKSMQSLSFHNCFVKLFDMTKRFTNLTTLEMVDSSFHYHGTVFSKELFPNLQRLHLRNNYYYSFPTLRHLPKLVQIYFMPKVHRPYDTDRQFNEKDIIDLIKYNPHVKGLHLHLRENHGHRIIKYVSQHFRSLIDLRFVVDNENMLTTCQESFHFNSVKRFSMKLLRPVIVSKNLFLFRNLQAFSSIEWIFDYECMIEFLNRNQNISKLSICLDDFFESFDHIMTRRILSTVRELEFEYVYEFSVDNVIEILKESAQLTKFSLLGYCIESYKEICEKLIRSGVTFEVVDFRKTKESSHFCPRNIKHALELYVTNYYSKIVEVYMVVLEDSTLYVKMKMM